jgi:AAA domain
MPILTGAEHLATLITRGKVERPTIVLSYGLENSRKTGSYVDRSCLHCDFEHGSDQYDVDRIHIETYPQFVQVLDLVIREKTQHTIIVVDPIEAAEKLLIDHTCQQLKIDGLQGLAHGAAWQYLRENFEREYVSRFKEIRRTGRNLAIIGHAIARTVTLPGLAESYDRYDFRLDRINAATLVELADHVLFYDWNVRTAKTRDGVVRAISNAEPIVRVLPGVAWTAKNRAGLTEPLKPEFASIAPLFGVVRPGVGVPAAAPAPTAAVTTPPAPVPPLEDEAAETPKTYDGIISDLTMQEVRAADAMLASLPQDRLLIFLRQRNLINSDADYHALSPSYVRRILADPEGFKQAVLS